MKVLGTNIIVYRDLLKVMKEFGYSGAHNKFRVVCKCKSMADANRKCESAGLGNNGIGNKVFRSGWSEETKNETEIAICETTDIAICIGGTLGNEYVTIEQVKEKMEELK